MPFTMTAGRAVAISVVLALLLAGGCEPLVHPVYPIPEYTGTLTWEMMQRRPGWQGRWDHAAVSFNGKIWILGGYSQAQTRGDSYLEDVWSSSDGITWTLVTGDAPWLGRRGHAAFVYNDGMGEAIYLCGGFSVDEATGYRRYNNDVWRSRDGLNWELIKSNTSPAPDSRTDWRPRFNHRCEVLSTGDSRFILLIAGAELPAGSPAYKGMHYFHDVWRSSDGREWEKLDNTDFGRRSEHATAVDPVNGVICLQGGIFGIHDETGDNTGKPVPQWQDLWHSTDGITWTPDNDTVSFDQSWLYRAQHQIIHYQGSLWGLPGKSSTSAIFARDPEFFGIWTINDRGEWSVDSEGPPFSPRHGYALVLFSGRIWILGGHTSDHGPTSEIWCGTL